jgi:hypothetical protein
VGLLERSHGGGSIHCAPAAAIISRGGRAI